MPVRATTSFAPTASSRDGRQLVEVKLESVPRRRNGYGKVASNHLVVPAQPAVDVAYALELLAHLAIVALERMIDRRLKGDVRVVAAVVADVNVKSDAILVGLDLSFFQGRAVDVDCAAVSALATLSSVATLSSGSAMIVVQDTNKLVSFKFWVDLAGQFMSEPVAASTAILARAALSAVGFDNDPPGLLVC